jgi:plasmid stabilization system protein ParE
MQGITFHEEADREVSEAASYYEDRAPDLGFAFIDEIEKVLQRILARPMSYQSIGDEIRKAPVERFPHIILYVVEPDERIRVIAVAHQKRRPGYWRSRLREDS